MSTCTVCQKDSRKHSEKLWEMHKQVTKCLFCNKTSDAHSEMLWDMHKGTVENARRKTRAQETMDHADWAGKKMSSIT